MKCSPGCYCIIDHDTGNQNGYTCNFCVNLLILWKNAVVEEKNELVRENHRLQFEGTLEKLLKDHQGTWNELAKN